MGMALPLKVLPLKVLPLLLSSDQGVQEALKGRRKWMKDHSGETGLDSGIESRRGNETGIETGTERETEVLEEEGVHLAMEDGEGAMRKWTEETGLEVGRKMVATVGEDGKETEKEIAIETATETATVIGTERDETGGRNEAALTETGNGGGVMMGRGIEGGGREEKEAGEKGAVGKEAEEMKEKEKGQDGQNVERGPRVGIGMIDWLNWKTWTKFGPLTAQSNLK